MPSIVRRRARVDSLARFAISVSGIAIALGVCVVMLGAKASPGDTLTYLAAGERLNAGHDLYVLSAGDRAVPIAPGYFTTPLVSPPLIAALWRVLAPFGDLAVYSWWAATLTALGILAALIHRAPGAAGPVALYLLSVPLGVEAAQGNINPFLEVGTLGVWALWAHRRPAAAGFLGGVMTAAKLTPAVLVVWLIGTRPRSGLLGTCAGLCAAGIISVLGAGISSHLEFLAVARSYGASDWSVGGVARALGVNASIANLVPSLVALLGVFLIIALRRRPVASFRAAVLLLVVGSPAVYANTFVFLAGWVAPFIWPVGEAHAASQNLPLSNREVAR